MLIALSILGLVLLVGGGDLLIRGAVRLASAAGVSPLVVGLTVVAGGTSAPEVAVGVRSALAGQGDIALGNAVGSNISNILLILGVSALVTPLVVHTKIVRLDVPIMIGTTLLVFLVSIDGSIGRVEGFGLFALLMFYIAWTVRASRAETKENKAVFEKEFGAREKLNLRHVAIDIGLILAGLAGLVLGAGWIVDGAVALARHFGISELVVGLTVIAVGTSLPEIATCIIAGFRGERDIAVGNVVGSNIFNSLGVLGVSAATSPTGIGVAPAALRFDIPVMIAASFACFPIFFNGHSIARWEAAMLLVHYVVYVVYLILTATNHGALAPYTWVMLAFVLPLTTITLAVVGVRGLRANRLRNQVTK